MRKFTEVFIGQITGNKEKDLSRMIRYDLVLPACV